MIAFLAQSVEHQTFNLRVKGSSPLSGLAIFFLLLHWCHVVQLECVQSMSNLCRRFYGVMVSTQDSESCDPSSNLGRTWCTLFVFFSKFYRHVTCFSARTFWMRIRCWKKIIQKDICQKWDSNPRPQKWTATWTQRLRPLGHPACEDV